MSQKMCCLLIIAFTLLCFCHIQSQPDAKKEKEWNCNKVELLKVGETTVWRLPEQSTFFYKAGMTIDADGAPNAYHPNNKGLDFLRNAGRPGNWWALVTDENNEPIIQGPNDPAPGFYISTTALVDPTKKITNPQRYVDSTKIPYIVLPPEVTRNSGARLGDFAVVINAKNRKLSCAIFANIGPKGKLGEGSIALAEALEIPSNAKIGGTPNNVIYTVFPCSGNRRPRQVEDINIEAAKLFKVWGGMKQIEACFPELKQ